MLIINKPLNVEYILADVSQDNCISKIQEIIKDKKIDLVINNAGIGGEVMTFEETTSKEIMDLINVHCLRVFLIMKVVIDNLKRNNNTTVNPFSA